MSCGVSHRHNSDPLLLWLWCRLAATAPIGPQVWEPPCAASAAQKKKKNHPQNWGSEFWEPLCWWFWFWVSHESAVRISAGIRYLKTWWGLKDLLSRWFIHKAGKLGWVWVWSLSCSPCGSLHRTAVVCPHNWTARFPPDEESKAPRLKQHCLSWLRFQNHPLPPTWCSIWSQRSALSQCRRVPRSINTRR